MLDHIKSRKLEDFIHDSKKTLSRIGFIHITQNGAGEIFAFADVPEYDHDDGEWHASSLPIYIDTVPLDTIVATEYLQLGNEDEN